MNHYGGEHPMFGLPPYGKPKIPNNPFHHSHSFSHVETSTFHSIPPTQLMLMVLLVVALYVVSHHLPLWLLQTITLITHSLVPHHHRYKCLNPT
jgi:hypothetical protein